MRFNTANPTLQQKIPLPHTEMIFFTEKSKKEKCHTEK